MLNRTKNILIRAALLATLAGGFAGVAVLGADGVADAQRRPRTSMVTDAPQADARSTGVVNINTAGQTELSRLPGIGPSKAAAIIAFRERGRRFRRVEDLLRVRGIGRATFRRLRPMLTVQGPTTLGGANDAQPAR
jgi:competence protein ComEA